MSFPAKEQVRTELRKSISDENGAVEFSLIIPLFNEAENIGPLVEKVTEFLKSFPLVTEVLLINDGSRDDTKTLIQKIAEQSPVFRAFHLRTQLGKSAVYSLGFKMARGQLIATMDGDLQDNPFDFIPMLNKMGEGYDCVIGWKYQGKSGWHKRIFSIAFNTVVRALAGIPLHDVNCPMRIMKRACLRHTHLQGELFRYLPLLIHWRGFRVAEVKVQNKDREAGQSKYGFRRYGQAFFDLFTLLFIHRYEQKPMHFFGMIGFVSFGIGVSIDSILTFRGLFITGEIKHFALLLFGVFLMLLGMQVILFGFLATLLGEKRREDIQGFLES
jgi:glycosyltransferase involved in cell wall biosynthesis